MIIKLLEVKEDISWSDLKKYVSLLTLKRQEKCERYIKEHDKCISLLSELLIFMELGKGKYKYVECYTVPKYKSQWTVLPLSGLHFPGTFYFI